MPRNLNRRSALLSGVALTSLAIATRQPWARTLSGEIPWVAGEAAPPTPFIDGDLRFFTAAEAAFVDAIMARLIPADDLGPGAREAGVTRFLDRQLAGSYGRAESWYMQGPWRKGTKSQGYQSSLAPAQLYRAAIKHIDAHCRQKFSGKAFNELTAEHQDEVITGLEKNTLEIPGIGPHSLEIEGAKSDSFFAVLMQHAVEGFFSDPIYGGNKGMAGWKLIGFPGARYNYLPYVRRHGEKLDLPPVAFRGRPEWDPAHS